MSAITLAPAGTTNRIGEHAGPVDVMDTLVVAVDAEPTTLRDALERLDLTASTARALHALGLADRLALPPTLLAATPATKLVFGLLWRLEGPAETIDPTDLPAFDTPGHVKISWDIRIQPSGGGGSLLTTTTRLTATDKETRTRLLAGWGLLGPLTKTLAQRTLATVKAYAENPDELAAHNPAATPTRLRPHKPPTQNARRAA